MHSNAENPWKRSYRSILKMVSCCQLVPPDCPNPKLSSLIYSLAYPASQEWGFAQQQDRSGSWWPDCKPCWCNHNAPTCWNSPCHYSAAEWQSSPHHQTCHRMPGKALGLLWAWCGSSHLWCSSDYTLQSNLGRTVSVSQTGWGESQGLCATKRRCQWEAVWDKDTWPACA